MDEFFGPAYIDRDEQRDTPVRHRYLHGGFEGTDTRFSFYLPAHDVYEGRFLQFLQGGMGGSEHHASMFASLQIAVDVGAYLVESNQGHIGPDLSGLKGDPTILAFRASAQSARFAATVAERHYGRPIHHGYVFGGSGGGVRSINCLEHAPDVYDGAVPFMINHGAFLNYNWSVEAFAEPTLRERLPQIVDAVDAGGSGDPFAVLRGDDERRAFATLYRAGYPRGAEFLIRSTPLYLIALQSLHRADPSYFSDFWTEPGYAGAEREPSALGRLAQAKAVVRDVVRVADLLGSGSLSEDMNTFALRAAPPELVVGVVTDLDGDLERFLGARLEMTGGDAAGAKTFCSGGHGDAVLAALDPRPFARVRPGDELTLDNHDFIAFAHYHRHLVDRRNPTMRQFFADENPMYPQRPIRFPATGGYRGRFEGKMIALQHTRDRECWPSTMDAYVRQLRDVMGDAHSERFRLWWIDNASHLPPSTRDEETRLIDYAGCVAQAVRDVVAWVEDGAEPPGSTPYHLDDSGRLAVPESASERLGIQPIVRAAANGEKRAVVAPGEAVRLTAEIEAPPDAGVIVGAEWDVDGSGSWAVACDEADCGSSKTAVSIEHTYATRGTYFATLRASASRTGTRPLDQVRNLDRVRIVVR